jgi:hypothetical protein
LIRCPADIGLEEEGMGERVKAEGEMRLSPWITTAAAAAARFFKHKFGTLYTHIFEAKERGERAGQKNTAAPPKPATS